MKSISPFWIGFCRGYINAMLWVGMLSCIVGMALQNPLICICNGLITITAVVFKARLGA